MIFNITTAPYKKNSPAEYGHHAGQSSLSLPYGPKKWPSENPTAKGDIVHPVITVTALYLRGKRPKGSRMNKLRNQFTSIIDCLW
jgi:hypothetical protein